MATNEMSRDMIIHPGETIAEFMELRGMTLDGLSKATGIPYSNIRNMIEGKDRISADSALRLETAFGVPAKFWMNLQRIYESELEQFEHAHPDLYER